jgi:hemolysin activation/secretion protein
MDFQFSLYKRDTSYIDLDYSIGARYFISAQNELRFYIRNISSNLLGVDTNTIIRTKMLPSTLDVRQNLLGVEYNLEKTNYRFNPRSGFRLNTNLSGGRKRIKKNNTITNLADADDPDFRFEDLYNERPDKSFQYNIRLGGAFFIPIFEQSTIMLGLQSGWMGSDDILFENELARIGGTKLLRGFNQESFQVSLYSIFTAEYRILFNQNSNLFVFTDWGYIEKNTETDKFSDRPLGLGVGMNLETKIGIFGISYAIGKQKNSALDFGEGKIHFGMVSIF